MGSRSSVGGPGRGTIRPPLVPREVLFGNPVRVQARISPDGTRLAYIGPRDGVLNVWVGEVGAPEQSFRAVTEDTDRGIPSYFWGARRPPDPLPAGQGWR